MENQNPEDTSPKNTSHGGEELNQENPIPVEQTRAIDEETHDDTPTIEELKFSEGPGGQPQASSSRSWIWISIIGIFTLLVIAGMAAVGGAEAGQSDRLRAESTQKADQILEQYALAMEDMEAGRDELARQRFEWIIQRDPNFPDVPNQLANVILRMSITASPTPAPTPTLTPTPDTRTRDELYQAARQSMANREWSNAIDILLKLRKESPDFHPIEVDGWLYIALRYRGLEKIKNADLEGGTYDLALAERFGPLDSEATNYRSWAELYVTGASFWDVDWRQAVSYFEQLRLIAPYLRDGSGWTSIDRYRIALAHYGDFLSQQGLWCEAQEQYQASLDVNNDPMIQPTAVYAAEQCASPPEDVIEEPLMTVTPTPTQEGTPQEPLPTMETPQPMEETPYPFLPGTTPTPSESSYP
jgi:tetratricopeptide (TPR) repeat protein